jgi:hypothetical protein
MCKNDDEQWLPVRKDTTLLTTKLAVAQAMNRHCPGDHQHCRLEGSLRGFQVHRATYMENYQPAMASTLAAAMATPEAPRNWEHGYAVQKITEHVGKLVELHVEGQVCCPSSCAEASQEPWTSLNGIFGRTFELQRCKP